MSQTDSFSVSRIHAKLSGGKCVILLVSKIAPVFIVFLTKNVEFHQVVALNELQPFLTGVSQLAVISKATQLLELIKADELLNVVLKKATLISTLNDCETKSDLSVLLDQ